MHKKFKKTLKSYFIFIILGVALVLASESGSAAVFLGKEIRKIPIYCVEPAEVKQVSLTFDAAWGSDKTLAILDELDNYKVKATFFLVGFWVEKYPDMVAEIDRRGHEIGTHSNTHPDMSKLSRESIERELSVSKKLIEDITKKKVTVFRCPFGAYNNKVIEVAESLGLKVIQWDVDSLDWKDLTAGDICKRVFARVKGGSIILFHNNSTNVVPAIRIIMDKLISQQYQFKTVSDILVKGDYTIDHTGMMKAL